MRGVPAADPDQAVDSGEAADAAKPRGIIRRLAMARQTGVFRWAALSRRPVMDWVAGGLFLLALIFVATGLLRYSAAGATMRRILPLLLFLGTVIVLAELTAEAGVFDVIAVRAARLGRGNYLALFVMCVFFAAFTTVVLNLDTTAVLLTPVMLALAVRTGIAAIPLAMTTVWLANTASLLLPVSNLTNLLAANRVSLPTADFAARMWPSELASVAATMVFLWVFYWRRGERGVGRYDPPPPHKPGEPVLFWVASLACLLFIVLIVTTTILLGVASSIAAALAVAAFALRRREVLRLRLIPFQLLVFVTGLFLVVQTLSLHGLSTVTRALIGGGNGAVTALRAAATGAGLSNMINNLPSYVAGEAVIPYGHREQLLALLIGTNVGPIITPWASLATLLWYERCRSYDAVVPVRKFALTGAGLAVCALAASVSALLLTG
jgi:Na+/H+ antiporter NhaD/arsenite permease-like protein